MSLNAKPLLSNLKGEIFGGLTAAVIALPLALAFGVASGLGPAAGLYGAIATGFFAALFGGTPAQVSGPTGPMTVVMGAVVAAHADTLPEAFAIVILGGALQILFGMVRVGNYVRYTPYSVVSGFMTGIGLIIIIMQALPFLGFPIAEGGPLGAVRAILLIDPKTIGFAAPALAIVSLGTILAWPQRFRRFIPSPLAALLVGTGLGVFVFTGAPSIGAIPAGFPEIHIPVFDLKDLGGMVQAGLVLALLGSIDSLLTSLVADSITRTTHDSNKELIGQGLGNIVAGLIGGLPGAGATMRTVINVRAGGRTSISGAIHALVLLTLALGLGPLASHIPLAVLAGILMKVGWDIIDWGYLKHIHVVPRDKAVVMTVTFLMTVFVDLITAVAVGIILAAFVNARALGKEQMQGVQHQSGEKDGDDFLGEEEQELLRRAKGRIIVTRLRGAFSYASARELGRRISQQILGRMVHIYDFSEAGYIDPSAAMALDDLFKQAISGNQIILIAGLGGKAKKPLKGFGVLDLVEKDHRFQTRQHAIMAALELVEQELETTTDTEAKNS
jgi:SulP family sulfate permease